MVLRFVSRGEGFKGAFLPAYQDLTPPKRPLDYGLQCVDHAVGNVWDLIEVRDYLGRMTGFHEFAEFTAEVSGRGGCGWGW